MPSTWVDATRPVAKAADVDHQPDDPLPLAPATPVPAVTTVVPAPATAAPTAKYTPRFEPLGSYLFGRLAAFVLDIFAVAFVIATFLFNWIFLQLASQTGSPLVALGLSVTLLHQALHGSFVLMSVFAFACTFAFVWICETIFGTTLGKLLFGLAIRRAAGGRAGPGRVFRRNLLRPIDALVVGGVLALVTPKHQRIGDLAGGTIVVRSPLGAIATLLAALGFILLGYAQLMYGGGFVSAAAVVTQTVLAVPRMATKFGGATPSPAPALTPGPARTGPGSGTGATTV